MVLLRGGIKIENRENLGQCPNRRWVGNKKTEMSQFQFGNFENRGGGVYFSKMSQFPLFDSVVCNITFIRNVWNSKMSQFGQRGEGGSAFFKNVWNSKMSQKLEAGGRGSTLFGTLSQIFSIFYFDASPKLADLSSAQLSPGLFFIRYLNIEFVPNKLISIYKTCFIVFRQTICQDWLKDLAGQFIVLARVIQTE